MTINTSAAFADVAGASDIEELPFKGFYRSGELEALNVELARWSREVGANMPPIPESLHYESEIASPEPDYLERHLAYDYGH